MNFACEIREKFYKHKKNEETENFVIYLPSFIQSFKPF